MIRSTETFRRRVTVPSGRRTTSSSTVVACPRPKWTRGSSEDGAGEIGDPARPAAQHLYRLAVPGQARDGDRAVREDEVEVAVQVEVCPRDAPAGEARVEGRHERPPYVGER